VPVTPLRSQTLQRKFRELCSVCDAVQGWMSSPHWHVSSSLIIVALKCLSFPGRCYLTERTYWTLLPMDNFWQQIILYLGTGPKNMAYGTKFLMLVSESPTHNKLATCKRNHVTVFIIFFIERGAVYGQGQHCTVSLDLCKTAAMVLVWTTHVSLNEYDAAALSQLFVLHISVSQSSAPGRTLKHLVQSGLRNWGT
jgi:hypothetical protein